MTRRLWATNVITSGLAMPLDMSGPLVAGGDVSAYEIALAGAVVFVALRFPLFVSCGQQRSTAPARRKSFPERWSAVAMSAMIFCW